MNGTTELKIQDWVPEPIRLLAPKLYADALARPQVDVDPPDDLRILLARNLPRAEIDERLRALARARPQIDPNTAHRRSIFAAHAKAIQRVVEDPRMQSVWDEIRKRQGGKKRNGPYVHSVKPEAIHSFPQFSAIKNILPQSDDGDRVQHQAAAILFLEITGHALWDRRIGIGPLTRTGASAIKPHPQSPWTVSRTSHRVGDEWDRGLIILVAETCEILFGNSLLATVATIANVLLGRSDISKGKVQGVIKRNKKRNKEKKMARRA